VIDKRLRKLMVGMVGAAGAGFMLLAPVRAEPLGCLIEPDRVAEVGTQSIGVIARLKVERGDEVHEGQLLARLSAQVEKASVAVAEARAAADAELKAALAANDLAQSKLTRARDLLKQDFVSTLAVEQADSEARVAAQRVVQAREARQVAERELNLSAAQLGQRDIRSPFDGIVVERYRTEGERVEREAIVRVAKIDPLRVEVLVPAAQFGKISVGQVAAVKPDLQQIGALQATVSLVDRVIDPASNSFRVRLSVPNPRNAVPSGLRCKVDFAGAKPGAAAQATPQPAADQSAGPNGTKAPANPAYRVPPAVVPTMPARISKLSQAM
jgi:RND family efflux transporter MFP subunit